MAKKKEKDKILGISLKNIIEYIDFVEKNKIAEFSIDDKKTKIVIKRQVALPISELPRPTVSALPTTPPTPIKKEEKKIPLPKEKEELEKYHKIVSPLPGIFYRAPSPTSKPYVEEGSLVKKGDTLCVIEAMKAMNKIVADKNGKIYKILVENGKPVKVNDVLFLIAVE